MKTISLLSVAAFAFANLISGSVLAQVRVTAVDEEISTMNETVAGDALIEGSHVLVGTSSGQGSIFSKLGMLGGGIGAMLGSAIDNSVAQSAAKDSAGSAINALKLKWFNEMNAAIKKIAAAAPEKYKLEIGTPEDPGTKLRVFARITEAKATGQFWATLSVKARIKDAEGKETRRDYLYMLNPPRPMTGEGGWTTQGPSSLRAASDAAVERLALVIAKDVTGAYTSKFVAKDLPAISWKVAGAEAINTSFLIEETEDTYVVFPSLNGKPLRFSVFVLDKANLKN